jgi:hypothetical protein
VPSYGLDDGGGGVQVPEGAVYFSLHHCVQTGSGAHPVGTRGSFPGVKWPGCEADHSPPSNAKVKKYVVLPLLPQYAFIAWCSVKAQGHITL